jgi:hypothetical protein
MAMVTRKEKGREENKVKANLEVMPDRTATRRIPLNNGKLRKLHKDTRAGEKGKKRTKFVGKYFALFDSKHFFNTLPTESHKQTTNQEETRSEKNKEFGIPRESA